MTLSLQLTQARIINALERFVLYRYYKGKARSLPSREAPA